MASWTGHNITATNQIERGILLGSVSLSTISSSIVLFIILLYVKFKWQTERFIVALCIFVPLNAVIDLYPQPPFQEWTKDRYCTLLTFTQGTRFVVVLIEFGILLLSLYAINTQKSWNLRLEVSYYLFCIVVGLGVSLYTYASCSRYVPSDGQNIDDVPKMKRLNNYMTYAWSGAVALTLILFVRVQLLVRKVKSLQLPRYQVGFQNRHVFELRRKLYETQMTAIESIVAPLRLYPLVFLISAAGEFGLVYYRDHCSSSSSKASCTTMYLVFSLLIDLRGFFYALIYFSNTEAKSQLSWRRILAHMNCCGRRNNVRFARSPVKYSQGARFSISAAPALPHRPLVDRAGDHSLPETPGTHESEIREVEETSNNPSLTQSHPSVQQSDSMRDPSLDTRNGLESNESGRLGHHPPNAQSTFESTPLLTDFD